MNEIILVPAPEVNPSEQPGAPDISVTGPVATAAKKAGESACTSTQHTDGAKNHEGSCATSAKTETKSATGSCATSGKTEAKVDVGSIATTEIPATIATAGDSCCSAEKSGKPAANGAN